MGDGGRHERRPFGARFVAAQADGRNDAGARRACLAFKSGIDQRDAGASGAQRKAALTPTMPPPRTATSYSCRRGRVLMLHRDPRENAGMSRRALPARSPWRARPRAGRCPRSSSGRSAADFRRNTGSTRRPCRGTAGTLWYSCTPSAENVGAEQHPVRMLEHQAGASPAAAGRARRCAPRYRR